MLSLSDEKTERFDSSLSSPSRSVIHFCTSARTPGALASTVRPAASHTDKTTLQHFPPLQSKDVPPRAVTLVLLELRDQYREADEAASGKNLRFSQTHRANNEVYLPHQGFEAMKNRPTRCTFFERGGTLRQRVPESFEGLGGSFQLTARIEDLAELGIEAFRDPDAAFDKAKRTAAENLAQKLEKDHKMEKGEALRSAELVMDPLELVHFHGCASLHSHAEKRAVVVHGCSS